MRRLVVSVAIGALVIACVQTDKLASESGNTDAGTDSGTTTSADGGSGGGGDAGSEASGAGPNLLTNADFELGCAAWDVGFGFISESTEAHGGKGSCKFCMDTNWEAFLEQSVKMNVEAGKSYYTEAWFKPALSIQNLEAAGYVESNLRASSPGADGKFTNGPTLTGDWLRVTAIFKPTLPAEELYVQFRLQQTGNPADNGNIICFYVDDVVLRRMD